MPKMRLDLSFEIIFCALVSLSIAAYVVYTMRHFDGAVTSLPTLGVTASFTNDLWKLYGQMMFREWRHWRAVLEEETTFMG